MTVSSGWIGKWVATYVGGKIFTDLKSSNRIELSGLGQGLFDF